MDAITLLEKDHAVVKDLLADLDRTTERGVKRRETLFTRVRTELMVHEVIEEEIFYPALKEHPKARDIVLEGVEEHNVVDRLMTEIAGTPYDDETWGAKCTVMRENVEHHIEEEEGDMFAKARQVFDADELQALGARMAARRESARGEVEAQVAGAGRR